MLNRPNRPVGLAHDVPHVEADVGFRERPRAFRGHQRRGGSGSVIAGVPGREQRAARLVDVENQSRVLVLPPRKVDVGSLFPNRSFVRVRGRRGGRLRAVLVLRLAVNVVELIDRVVLEQFDEP